MSDEGHSMPGSGQDEIDDRTVKRSQLSPEHPGVDIVFDTSVVRSIRGHTLIGRDPAVEQGAPLAELMRIDDDAMSLSKTHIALDVEGGRLVLCDLGSTNGTSVSSPHGERVVRMGERVSVEVGDRVHIGDRWFDVGHAGLPPLAEPVVQQVSSRCLSCGSTLQAIDRYCIQCGTPVGGQPDEIPPEADRSRSKPVFIAVGALVVVVAVAAGAFIFLRGDDDAPAAASAAPRVPDQVESVWDTTLEGSASVTGTPEALFVATMADDDVELFRFDGEGTEVWSSRGRGASSAYLVDVVDGQLIAVFVDESSDSRMVAFDPATGDEVWGEDLDNDEGGRTNDGRLFISTDREVALVDAATGERLERVRGDSASLRSDFVFVRDDDEVEIFDLSLAAVTDPIRIGDDVGVVAFDGSSLFVAEEGEITAYDSKGEELWNDDTSHDFINTVLPASGGRILISGSDGVELMAVADGRLESAWDRDGSIEGVFSSGGRSLVTVFDDDEVVLLDMITGDEVVSFDLATWSGANAGSNAIVVFESDGDEMVARAISPADGEELWDLSDDGAFTLLDNGIVRTFYDFDVGETDIEVYK